MGWICGEVEVIGGGIIRMHKTLLERKKYAVTSLRTKYRVKCRGLTMCIN